MVPAARLRWTPVTTAHTFRHGVRTNEVEEVIAGTYLAEPGYGGRTIFIGESRAGRFLTVVVESEGAGQSFFGVGSPRQPEGTMTVSTNVRRSDDMTQQREKRERLTLPDFSSREEDVAFLDTQDVTDYFAFDKFRKFEGEVARSKAVTLHIDVETWADVRHLAPERDLPPDGLLHVWILERRDAERERRKTAFPADAPAGSALPAAERVISDVQDDR